jgi:hypothetical protein
MHIMKDRVISGARAGARELARQEQRFVVFVAVLVLCALMATFLGPRAGTWSFFHTAGVIALDSGSAIRLQGSAAGPW